METITYLSLGSNVGDREKNLREAIARLGEFGRVRQVSSIYETEPVEFQEQAWFLNCVAELETSLSAVELLDGVLCIEKAMGRERVVKKGPRNIDIDILLFGDEVIQSRALTVPHPAMHERRFVLEPLVEIAEGVKHPRLGKSARELLAGLPEGPVVRKN
jgi:2-amino-4-hydroxy-6-hydroxymethyldihydropteridine diphosphokinase